MPILIITTLLGLLLITVIFSSLLTKQEKEKNEVFHIMSHRFRSPVALIKWYMELMSYKSIENLTEKQKEYFDEIHKASEKINDTIDSFNVYLQLKSNTIVVKNEKINIKELTDQTIQKLQFKIDRHKLSISKSYPEQDITIQGDTKLFGIILFSLIENAIKCSPEGGVVGIKLVKLNGELLVEIKDSGFGIPRKKITKNILNSVSYEDLNFNINFAKLIMNKIQINYRFDFQENKGTTMSVFLPI
jgi:signal transduction histidine kinase